MHVLEQGFVIVNYFWNYTVVTVFEHVSINRHIYTFREITTASRRTQIPHGLLLGLKVRLESLLLPGKRQSNVLVNRQESASSTNLSTELSPSASTAYELADPGNFQLAQGLP
jgi:hypothetical protein